MSILAISGSPSRHPSRSSALLVHVADRLRAHGIAVDTIDVRDLPAEDLVEVRSFGAAAQALRTAVAASEAIVIATPVYNAAIPGALKALLDLLAEKALLGKPVLPLASGGSAGHQLAIEYSLKPVLSALGARHVMAGVFAADADVRFEADVAVFGAALDARLTDAVESFTSLLGSPVAPVTRLRPAPSLVPIDRSEHAAVERCSA